MWTELFGRKPGGPNHALSEIYTHTHLEDCHVDHCICSLLAQKNPNGPLTKTFSENFRGSWCQKWKVSDWRVNASSGWKRVRVGRVRSLAGVSSGIWLECETSPLNERRLGFKGRKEAVSSLPVSRLLHFFEILCVLQ